MFRHVAARTLRLRLSSGESIEATPEHPFFVKDKGFRPAKVLAAGMILATLAQPVKVEAVTPIEKAATVYNFGVDKDHTYFVGNSGVWVHNDCVLRSILTVINKPFRYKPDIVTEPAQEWFERQGMSKLSQFLGQKAISAPNSQSGFDGWLRTAQTGEKFSLKYVDDVHAETVVRAVQTAQSKANKNGFKGGKIIAVIDAPNLEASKILDALEPNGHLDRIAGTDDTISKIIIFCKRNSAIQLDAP